MLSEEQEKAAARALSNIRLEKMFKKYSLLERQDCIEDVNFYKLPYRLLILAYRGKLQDEKEIRLNRFYPQQELSKQQEEEINEEMTEDELLILFQTFETPEDKREFYFTPFLELVDLESFNNFDWTGDVIDRETESILKQHYKERLADYKEHPEKYFRRILKSEDPVEYGTRYSLKKRLKEIWDELE